MSNTTYPVVVYAGTRPDIAGARLIDVTPKALTIDAIVAALGASGITPSDLRNKVLLATDLPSPAAVAVAVAVFGYAGRRVDVAIGADIVRAPRIDEASREMADAGRPATPVALAQIGLPHITLPYHVGAVVTPDEVSLVRYAKRLRYVPSADARAAIFEIATIGGIRAKGTLDRLPFLVDGTEPVGDNPLDTVGLCLDTLKRSAAALRRSARSDDRSAVAPTERVSARDEALAAAAAGDIVAALDRLGAHRAANADGDAGVLWHCPRPANHANADANPGLRINANKAQCLRCDVEPVDALRLVMSTKGLCADDAVAFLA